MNKISESSKFHSLTTFLLSFLFLVSGLGISAYLLFSGVKFMINDNPYRSVLHITMPFYGYHFGEIDEKPFLYLLSIVLISAIIGAFWITFIAPRFTRYIKRQILVIPWICVIITSPIWGIIWSVNLRNPQYFVEHYSNDPRAVMWLFYRTDAMSGLTTGWLSAIQSFPINVLSYTAFCLLLFASHKLFLNTAPERVVSPFNEKPA